MGCNLPSIIGRDESMKSSIAVLFSLLFVFTSIALGDTSMDRIMLSLEAGSITQSEAANMLIQSVVNPDALPTEYTDNVEAVTCGTPAILEAFHLQEDVDLLLANRPILSGPEYTFNSDDDHFKIHWTDSGSDATTLSYAQTLATAADSSWDKQCNGMGYFWPPPDANVGGDNRYDIYVKAMGGGVLGYCSPIGEYHPHDSTHACSASHIVINKSIGGLGQRNCVVAHEFQHAVQFSYSFEESTWFMENCAVWMEEMVYPSVNDYLMYVKYGENPLRYPWKDIRSGSMYWYGGVIWPWMMWIRYDENAVREIWEHCAENSGSYLLQAHEEMFANHGTDMEAFFMDYGCWRWFTASNWFSGCGMYNSEVQLWTPGPRVLSFHYFTSLPASGDQTASYKPDKWGIHWIRLDVAAYQNRSVEMDFNGHDGFEWNLGVIRWEVGSDFDFNWYECDPTTGDYTVVVETETWDFIIFFPALIDASTSDRFYEFDITDVTGIEGSPETPDMLNMSLSSNPLNSGGYVNFNLPVAGNARICVFDMSGRMADILIDEEMPVGSHSVQFNRSELADGTYFITLFANNQIAGRKVVLIK